MQFVSRANLPKTTKFEAARLQMCNFEVINVLKVERANSTNL